jgi:hypothetical protein
LQTSEFPPEIPRSQNRNFPYKTTLPNIMKKEICLIILISILSFETFSQAFELKKPNIGKIKEQLKIDSKNEGIYHYLTNYYNTSSEPYEKEFYEWKTESICSFKKDFESNIKYSISQCKEAGGISVTVEFPKISRKNIMNWIEKIYEIDKTESDDNIWKENNTRFEPREINPGCYYKILETEKNTIVELYCGC